MRSGAVLKMRRLLGAFAALMVVAAAAPASAKIFAVVVGVDAYERLNPLAGAANDARDLAGALNRLGAEVELLLDRDATRTAVERAFERQARRAGPGDLFVFTYAGHGLQEPEAFPGEEEDGFDETIVFAAFDHKAERAGERLRDNEIGRLLGLVHPKARALVVIDSCHSGTMTRDVDIRGRKLATRFGGIGRISDDPLPKPDPATKGKDVRGDNVIFVAAARDEEQIPEVHIDGSPRGAVSWAVARALEGFEDFGGPNMPLHEFRSYVRAQARALSAARQTPSVNFDEAIADAEPIVPETALAAPPPPPRARKDDPDRPALVYTLGDAGDEGIGAGGRFTSKRETSDLLWDVAKGELIDRDTADMVAEVWDVAELRDALAKWRAVRRLNAWAGRRPHGFRATPGDGRHRLGEHVGLVVERPERQDMFLTIVNLPSDGGVQFVFPDAANRRAELDIVRAGEGEAKLGEAPVTYPLGADHVIAILSPERPAELHRALDGSRMRADEFVALLKASATREGYRVGVAPIYTTR